MRRPPLVLATSAPCLECVRLWFPKEWNHVKLKQDQAPKHGRRRKRNTVFRNVQGKIWREPFFPHPECHRHPPLPGATPIDRLSASPLGPFKFIGPLGQKKSDEAFFIRTAVMTSAITGFGTDSSETMAELKAKMEAIERSCFLLPPRAEIIWGSASEIGRAAMASRDIPRETQSFWCGATRFPTGENGYVPLEYLSVPRIPANGGKTFRTDTSGMAAHRSRRMAVVAGLQEVLERVGVEFLWRNGVKEQWDLSDLRGLNPDLQDAIAKMGFRITAIGSNPVPGFTACIVILTPMSPISWKESKPAAIFGTGGGWSVPDAFKRGLVEAYAQLFHALSLGITTPDPSYPENFNSMLYYFSRKNAHSLFADWGVDGARKVRPRLRPRASLNLGAIIDRLRIGVAVVDRGNPFCDSIGVSVVQVVIPGILPLSRGQERGPGLIYPF